MSQATHSTAMKLVEQSFDNPFSTSRTRPGAVAFLFGADAGLPEAGADKPSGPGNTAEMIDRLAAAGWRGQIVGPHGSGKSTLLAALIPEIEASGRAVSRFDQRDGQRTLDWRRLRNDTSAKTTSNDRATRPSAAAAAARATSTSTMPDEPLAVAPPVIVVVDGYEQLSRWSRWRLDRLCRRRGWGLVVTVHEAGGMPTLASLRPSRRMATRVARSLLPAGDATVTDADIEAAFDAAGGNMRETLFALYDLYERRRRGFDR